MFMKVFIYVSLCTALYLFLKYSDLFYKIIFNMESRRFFSSNTLMGREEHKKVSQLLQNLMDSQDSFDFREPVDYLALGLMDYPIVVKKPMDLGTVRRNLSNNSY